MALVEVTDEGVESDIDVWLKENKLYTHLSVNFKEEQIGFDDLMLITDYDKFCEEFGVTKSFVKARFIKSVKLLQSKSQKLDTLLSMGFQFDTAKIALSNNNNNLLGAIQSLFEPTTTYASDSELKQEMKLHAYVDLESKHEDKAKDGKLLISDHCIVYLDPGKQYEYESIELGKHSKLKTRAWNGANGGKLFIKSLNDILLHEYSSIDVSNCGYRGSQESYFSGESYLGLGSCTSLYAKYNGGAGGGTRKGGSGAGGGGGYGTNGGDGTENGKLRKGSDGEGGITYGDVRLSTLYMGAAGGIKCAGNGGGVINIECKNNIFMKQKSSICSNGGNGKNGYWYCSGGGSGGSIKILCNELVMEPYSCITAKGGRGGSGTGYFGAVFKGGDGGYGRIRVDSIHQMDHLTRCKFEPNPYIEQIK